MLRSVRVGARLPWPWSAVVSRFLPVLLILVVILCSGHLVLFHLFSITTVCNIREASPEMKVYGAEERPQNLKVVTPTLRAHHASRGEFPYKYLINEPHLCHDRISIINMIPIASYSLASRRRIRNTWGNRAAAESTGMMTVFVLGVTNNIQYQQLIEEESQTYHDIIQVNFIDSYRNLTLKTLTILHWTKTYCPGASWLLKSDEDIFVNPFALRNIVANHTQAGFVCFLNRFLWVCRKGKNCPQKWAVSSQEYQHSIYPPYCLGPAYAISSNMVRKVFTDANKTHPFVMEDVYFTGILALHHMAEYVDLKGRFYFHASDVSEILWNGTTVFSMISPKARNASHYILWDKIVNYNQAIPLL
ncbi:beta-1,3-galactosyltransferase 5-like [Scylla paramamosain]|uniref:beta-1,3-galactosyltransferase 5-like n=1 Tax=Scylla paramamosain TaxID=85552 RepID=UPI0030838DD2